MKDYFYLIPIALGLGLSALAAFMWSLKTRQYDDLEGAAAANSAGRRRSDPNEVRAVTSRPSANAAALLADQLLARTP